MRLRLRCIALVMFALCAMAFWYPLASQITLIVADSSRTADSASISRRTKLPVRAAYSALWTQDPFVLLRSTDSGKAAVSTMRVTLGRDATFQMRLSRLERQKNGTFVLTARSTEPDTAELKLSVSSAGGIGFIRTRRDVYRLSWKGGRVIEAYRLNRKDYPREKAPRDPLVRRFADSLRAVAAPNVRAIPASRAPGSSTALAMLAPAGSTSDPSGENTIDLLVVYTQQVLGEYGDVAAVQSAMQLAVDDANQAYEDSGVDQRLSLVAIQQVSYIESNDIGTDLDRLEPTDDGVLDEVHRYRDSAAADVVVLVVGGSDQCGEARLQVVSSSADDDKMFAVVHWNCLDNYTLAHEVGHLGGAFHEHGVDPVENPFTNYAHGFVSTAGAFYTIMAYGDSCSNDPNCTRVGRFSNPARSLNGFATGDSHTADNRRRLNETVHDVKSYRIRGPRVGFYEGQAQTQDHVCVVSVKGNSTTNFSASNPRHCDNDEAQSMVLFSVPRGRVVRLYDDPSGSMNDDWLELMVKRDITEKRIDNMEASIEDDDISLVYHRHDGLNGKVSRLVVAADLVGPRVDLHEGIGGSENLVCSLNADPSRSVNFTQPGSCANDEAKSATLHNYPAGRSVRLYDSPSGSATDDWVEITVKRLLRKKLVPTLEANSEDDDIRVRYHRNDGLNGKVSRAVFAAAGASATADFYEAEAGTQNLVCALSIGQNNTWKLGNTAGCDNDEAKSVVIHGLAPGRALRIYDDPDGKREDDWTQIEALAALDMELIHDFEQSYSNGRVRVTYFRNNGLNGKVSRVEAISAVDLKGVVSFFEGTGGSQNKVCDRNIYSRTIKFEGECDNDEAKSLVLNSVLAGTVIKVYDKKSCETGDDWTVISVKRTSARIVVHTFEANAEDDDVKVTYHHDNGLNGKVSCVKIEVP